MLSSSYSIAIWLFWLTFASMNRNQFHSFDCCLGAALFEADTPSPSPSPVHATPLTIPANVSVAASMPTAMFAETPMEMAKNATKSPEIATEMLAALPFDMQKSATINFPLENDEMKETDNKQETAGAAPAPKYAGNLRQEDAGGGRSGGGDNNTDTTIVAADANVVGSIDFTNRVEGKHGPMKEKQKHHNANPNIKNAKNTVSSDNFLLDFRENVARLFTNEATGEFHHQYNSNNNTNQSLVGNANTPIGRRHIVPEKLQYTKEIIIKQGHLMGIIRNFHASTGLRDVDQYLGLPYAEAPVGSRRFMPPGAALPWQGLKIARHLSPVCPQKLPDILIQGNAKMSRGRYKHLTRLMPYLRNESEDCLYLNLYVPRQDGLEQAQLYPVVVYIHGESFEWNAGNPYDGSVLASYGQVIVVTLNYRLGVFGFLKPGIGDNIIANFGLLDQIAALHWIKENIGYFGGDKESVTLMGHSTGAASVNYLMVSPVASGLFHRAILMSGSAMSDWAVSNHSIQLTMQIAHALNCPLNDENEEMMSCLRQQRYQDILRIPTSFPQFATALGPIVDGHVIPDQPYLAMGQHSDYFSRYDLLFGITESESYHTLGAEALEEGLRENERDNLLRFYMQSRFDVRPDLALAATLKKYSDMYTNPIKATNLEHRDVVLDILSDARVVGPLMQTGLFHADVNRQNYMYVFGHNSAAGPYASVPHSIAGEELAFVFGAPLAPVGPFPQNYTRQEKLLTEAVMSYWTNFAKTGNPKAPWKGMFLNLHAVEWDNYDKSWPEFNKRTQAYFNIGIPPSIGYKYRQIYMNFWNKELPDELNQIAAIQQQPFLPIQYQRGGTASLYPGRIGSEVITGHMSKYGTRDKGNEDPVRTLKLLLQDPYGSPMQVETAENMYNAPPTFGVAKQREEDLFGMNALPLPGMTGYGGGGVVLSNNGIIGTTTSVYGVNKFESDNRGDGGNLGNGEKETEVAKSETTMQLLIGLIVIFIVLNIAIYSTFLLQKKKKANAMNRKLGGILSYDGATDDELKRSKQTTQNDGDDSYVLDMVRKSNAYESVKMERSPINGYKITRQLSGSTVDTHTKVCEWISGKSVGAGAGNGCGVGKFGTLTRMNGSPELSKKSSSPTFSSLRDSNTECGVDGSKGNGSGSGGTFAQQPHKVSVAVDATPEARSNSVLRQEPIELTKLRTMGGKIIICQDVEVDDQELLMPQSSLDASRYTLMRQHSATTEACEDELAAQQQLRIDHKHSRSDPIEMSYNNNHRQTNNPHFADETITSFMHATGDEAKAKEPQPSSSPVDINVTSRDESDYMLASAQPLTPEQQLMLMKSRNYPKVLPTTTARATDSPPMTVDLSTTYKRNSLPPNSFLPYFHVGRQHPPIPPPRTISTLGRRPSNGGRRNSNNITTSPLMVAQDCTEEECEPEIAQNTLIVGPIVPKQRVGEAATNEPNYSTLRREVEHVKAINPSELSVAKSSDEQEINCTEANSDSANDIIRTANVNVPTAIISPGAGSVGGNGMQVRLPAASGSFQTFESVPAVDSTMDQHQHPAEHHIEKVYTIEPNTQPSAATGIGKDGLNKEVIYAQSTKMTSKQNLASANSKSGIPRIKPTFGTGTSAFASESDLTSASTSEQNPSAMGNDTAKNCNHVQGNENAVTNATGSTPSSTQSRIPLLSRHPSIHGKQMLKEKTNDNISAATAEKNIIQQPTASPSSTSTPLTTSSENLSTLMTDSTKLPCSSLTQKGSNNSLANAGSAGPSVVPSARSMVLKAPRASFDSDDMDSCRASTATTNSSSSTSSSSSSSTGTVRTELHQK